MGNRLALLSLAAALVATGTPAQDASRQDALARLKAKLANKCGYEGMSCMCSWKFENRPNTRARNYFLTEKFWNQVPKACWKEIIQFSHTERSARGARMTPGKIQTPVLEKALAAAREQNKMVLFIAMTGG